MKKEEYTHKLWQQLFPLGYDLKDDIVFKEIKFVANDKIYIANFEFSFYNEKEIKIAIHIPLLRNFYAGRRINIEDFNETVVNQLRLILNPMYMIEFKVHSIFIEGNPHFEVYPERNTVEVNIGRLIHQELIKFKVYLENNPIIFEKSDLEL